jgi:signal peptide peptidase SppA
VLRQRGDGASFSGHELHAELNVAAPRPQRTTGSERVIQVIPIVGVIANRAQSMGVGADEIGAMVDAAVANPRVDAIVLDIDSPGGTVTGVPELAAKVFAARGVKPVVAVANGLMASAAYWIGSAASEVVASPSSEVGSIGVIAMHEDWSAAMEQEGVKVTEFSAGKYKTEGAPWKPLGEEAETRFTERVAEVYAWFVRDVAAHRGDTPAAVRAGYGEGRVLSAKEAKAVNLIDRIATMEETIMRLAVGKSPRSGMRADAPAFDTEARKRARMRGA